MTNSGIATIALVALFAFALTNGNAAAAITAAAFVTAWAVFEAEEGR